MCPAPVCISTLGGIMLASIPWFQNAILSPESSWRQYWKLSVNQSSASPSFFHNSLERIKLNIEKSVVTDASGYSLTQ